ncbi:MAG: hypothetical protein IT449_18090 [Phycisphaerales bacterium]|nr:hypothetical protein [Phycisphaerales bacterium]
MTIDQLRSVQRAKPFRPYRLHVADGDVMEVRRQEFGSTSPSGRTLVVFGEGDEMSIIDLLLVSRIEMTNGASAKH